MSVPKVGGGVLCKLNPHWQSSSFNSIGRSLFIQIGGWSFSADDVSLRCVVCLSRLHPGLCHEEDMPGLYANTHYQPTNLHSLHYQVENGRQ